MKSVIGWTFCDTAGAPLFCGHHLHIVPQFHMIGDPGIQPPHPRPQLPLHLPFLLPGLAIDQTSLPLNLRWWAKPADLLDPVKSLHPPRRAPSGPTRPIRGEGLSFQP